MVFAKDDCHAEDIVEVIREEFGKGNDFCKKITYRTMERTEDLIASFRNSYNPSIAVTVDMISTGTDIRPLECLLFMRDVRSSVYFEQMKGRGTRTISDTDLKAVTPGTESKTHFVIVDAVGVCESDKTDSRPLERKRTTPFETLVNLLALGVHDVDTLTSLAGRLARVDRELDSDERKEVEATAGGKSLKQIVNGLFDAVDPDKQIEKAKKLFGTETPTPEQVEKASSELAKTACALFDSPVFRGTLIEVNQRNEQTIDVTSKDEVVYAGNDPLVVERAKLTVKSFKDFIQHNKDELTALQIIYSRPYGQKHLTYGSIKELANALQKIPYNLTPELVWLAYQQLEKSKVKAAGPQKLLTNIVSLVRFATGKAEFLEPFSTVVDYRFNDWLIKQQVLGKRFTPEQIEWLNMIKEHITTSLNVGIDDFELSPFNQKGGAVKAYQLFGKELNKTLQELNTVLTK